MGRGLDRQLSMYGSDQPLNERVRQWHMWQGLGLAHLKNPQMDLPGVKLT